MLNITAHKKLFHLGQNLNPQLSLFALISKYICPIITLKINYGFINLEHLSFYA